MARFEEANIEYNTGECVGGPHDSEEIYLPLTGTITSIELLCSRARGKCTVEDRDRHHHIYESSLPGEFAHSGIRHHH